MSLIDVDGLGHVFLHDIIFDVLLCLFQDVLLGHGSLIADTLVVQVFAHGEEGIAGGCVAQSIYDVGLAVVALGL